MPRPIFKDSADNSFEVSRDVIFMDDDEGNEIPMRIGKDQLMSIVSSNVYIAFEYSWGFIYLYPDGTYEISKDSN